LIPESRKKRDFLKNERGRKQAQGKEKGTFALSQLH